MTMEEKVRQVATALLEALARPEEAAFGRPRYMVVDYCRMACHLLFQCQRCGTCCRTGDPIRLRREDLAAIARHLKIPLSRAAKKYTLPDPERPEALLFRHVKPCKFYDEGAKGCKIYPARPWSCRIFPFLGIYGSEDQVLVHSSCPGSLQAMKDLERALEEARTGSAGAPTLQEARMAREKLERALKEV
jgi:Fe-S-cluster containining protein